MTNDNASASVVSSEDAKWLTAEEVDWHPRSDLYWWYDGRSTCPVNIAVDCSGKLFATAGQWGWGRSRFVEEMGGLWLPLACPEPSEELKKLVPSQELGE